MNSDEQLEILKKREYLVVKGNELIQQNRFELSLTEQKTVAFICPYPVSDVSHGDESGGIDFCRGLQHDL